MGPGSLFGEIALIRDGVRVANVVAAEPSTIFRIAVADVLNLVRQHPDLGRHLQELARQRAGG
jgi:CRP-like cAMP-binding protein